MNDEISLPKVNGGGSGSRTYSFSGSPTVGPCVVLLSPVSVTASVFLRGVGLFFLFGAFVLE